MFYQSCETKDKPPEHNFTLSDSATKFNPPTAFSFDKSGEWPDWRQRFVRFRTATKLNKEDGVVQVSSLIYARGSEAENAVCSFTFVAEKDR